MAKRKTSQVQDLAIGDYVTIVEGDNAGWSGILDNVFERDGVTMYAVIDENDSDAFHYATAINAF